MTLFKLILMVLVCSTDHRAGKFESKIFAFTSFFFRVTCRRLTCALLQTVKGQEYHIQLCKIAEFHMNKRIMIEKSLEIGSIFLIIYHNDLV